MRFLYWNGVQSCLILVVFCWVYLPSRPGGLDPLWPELRCRASEGSANHWNTWNASFPSADYFLPAEPLIILIILSKFTNISPPSSILINFFGPSGQNFVKWNKTIVFVSIPIQMIAAVRFSTFDENSFRSGKKCCQIYKNRKKNK